MGESYYQNNGMMARRTNNGFKGVSNAAAVAEKMRQSRMSMVAQNPLGSNMERATPMEMSRQAAVNQGVRAGHSIGKFKQAPNVKQLVGGNGYNDGGQYKTLGLMSSESEVSLNKKNMKSNVHLQPLSYKTNMPV